MSGNKVFREVIRKYLDLKDCTYDDDELEAALDHAEIDKLSDMAHWFYVEGLMFGLIKIVEATGK